MFGPGGRGHRGRAQLMIAGDDAPSFFGSSPLCALPDEPRLLARFPGRRSCDDPMTAPRRIARYLGGIRRPVRCSAPATNSPPARRSSFHPRRESWRKVRRPSSAGSQTPDARDRCVGPPFRWGHATPPRPARPSVLRSPPREPAPAASAFSEGVRTAGPRRLRGRPSSSGASPPRPSAAPDRRAFRQSSRSRPGARPGGGGNCGPCPATDRGAGRP